MLLTVLISTIAVLLAVAVYYWRTTTQPVRRLPLAQAKRRFHTERERLEAKFIRLASERLGPEAPQWADCNFADDVAYVRSRRTGELSAFVALTIATDDADPSTAGISDAVGNLQAGTAVFRLDGDHWVTDGRALLNLSPSEAVYRFRGDLEIVGEELAHH